MTSSSIGETLFGAGRFSEAFQLIAQFDTHAFSGLLAHAGNLGEPRVIVGANRSHHVGCGNTAKDGDGQLGPNAADGDEFFEELLLFGAQKSVESQRIFADVGMDMQRDFAAHRGQFRKSRNRDGDVVPHACGFDDGLAGMLRDEAAAEMSNHGAVVSCR